MKKRALLIMAKKPAAGRTKTRLSPPFTLAEAAALYTRFLQDAIEIARSLPNVTPFIAYAPSGDGDDLDYFSTLVPDFELIAQVGETLGDRLDYVMSTCLQNGYDQVVAMCSDSPALPADYVLSGFTALKDERIDVTLGPCDDGGYYLIGWKRPYPRMVKEVTMSTEDVFADTMQIAKADGIRVKVLPKFWDIDTAEDIERLKNWGQDAKHTLRFLSKKQSTENS